MHHICILRGLSSSPFAAAWAVNYCGGGGGTIEADKFNSAFAVVKKLEEEEIKKSNGRLTS